MRGESAEMSLVKGILPTEYTPPQSLIFRDDRRMVKNWRHMGFWVSIILSGAVVINSVTQRETLRQAQMEDLSETLNQVSKLRTHDTLLLLDPLQSFGSLINSHSKPSI